MEKWISSNVLAVVLFVFSFDREHLIKVLFEVTAK